MLLSQSEVEKTFIADSFPNGSEASCGGISHKLQVRVERVVCIASLLKIEITSWKARAYGIFTRVGEVSEIEQVSAANE